jgi:hypothetical protein
VHRRRPEAGFVEIGDGRAGDVLHRDRGGEVSGVLLQELGEAPRLTLGLEEGRPLEGNANLVGHADEERSTLVARPARAP